MSDALRRVYASNPIDAQEVQTIELEHVAFSGGFLRFAQWHETIRVRTENCLLYTSDAADE